MAFSVVAKTSVSSLWSRVPASSTCVTFLVKSQMTPRTLPFVLLGRSTPSRRPCTMTAIGSSKCPLVRTSHLFSILRVAGFECRIWYRRQPQSCPICRAPGHRPKECPLNGVCRRCRQPGHVARHCRRSWGSPASKPSRGRTSARQAPAEDQPAASAAGSDACPLETWRWSLIRLRSMKRCVPVMRRWLLVLLRLLSRDRGAVPFPPPDTIGSNRPADLSSRGDGPVWG